MKAEDLSWQDIRRIVQIADEMVKAKKGYVIAEEPWFGSEEGYYEEVLKRFKEDEKCINYI